MRYQLIEDLIRVSHEYEGHYNCWSLIRSPEQELPFENPTHLPIAPFHTGFDGWTFDRIGTFMASKTQVFQTGGDDEGADHEPFSSEVFGVLDDRSVRDRTMWLVERTQIAPGAQPGSAEELPEEPLWRPFRFKFEDAACEAGPLEVEALSYYEEQDEKGVDAVLSGGSLKRRPTEILEKLSPP